MRLNYLKFFWRSLSRNLAYSLCNMAGLVIGFSAFLLIIIYLDYETSFEAFHSKAKDIHRITYSYLSGNGTTTHWARVPVDYVNKLPSEFPEIRQLIRFQNHEKKYIRIGKEKFTPQHIYTTDHEVLEVFNFQLIAGDPTTALVEPNSIVIAASIAQKYFGTIDCVGAYVHINGYWETEEDTYQVTGVMEDVPSNTHLPVQILLSFKNEAARAGWAYVYALLEKETKLEHLQSKMPDFIEKYAGLNPPKEVAFQFQPIEDIHLHSNLSREITPNGNVFYVKVFLLIGLFLLLIAWLNYANLNVAMAVSRYKEIGLRKMLGASRRQIIAYFLTESILINMCSMLAAGFVVYLTYPWFSNLTNAHLVMNPATLGSSRWDK